MRGADRAVTVAHKDEPYLSVSALRRMRPLAFLLALTACGHASQTQELVHGRDISVTAAEFDQIVDQVPAEQTAGVRRTILDRLIDQKLLAQQASDQKLDRTPAVMQRIEAAKRIILAQAYAERATARTLPPDADAARAFYDQHPELYAQRRVVEVDELELTGTPADLARQKATFVKGGGSLPSMQAALAAEGRPNTSFLRVRAPEDLPPALVTAFAAVRPGQPVIYQLNGSLNLGVVRRIEPAPLPYKMAAPVILRLMSDQHRQAVLDGELKTLRQQADLHYEAPSLKRAGITL